MPRKPFLLRIDPALLDEIQRWANDDLRSLNGQIEFLLRKSLIQSGRRRAAEPEPPQQETSAPSSNSSQASPDSPEQP